LAQEVLNALLDKYMNEGIHDIESLEILSNDPYQKIRNPDENCETFRRQKRVHSGNQGIAE
jgi:type I restriction enzyme R subunit